MNEVERTLQGDVTKDGKPIKNELVKYSVEPRTPQSKRLLLLIASLILSSDIKARVSSLLLIPVGGRVQSLPPQHSLQSI